MTLFLRVGPPAPRTPVNGLRCYCDQTSQDVLRHSQILMRSITFLLRVLRAPQTFPFQLLRGPKKNTTREKIPLALEPANCGIQKSAAEWQRDPRWQST